MPAAPAALLCCGGSLTVPHAVQHQGPYVFVYFCLGALRAQHAVQRKNLGFRPATAAHSKGILPNLLQRGATLLWHPCRQQACYPRGPNAHKHFDAVGAAVVRGRVGGRCTGASGSGGGPSRPSMRRRPFLRLHFCT